MKNKDIDTMSFLPLRQSSIKSLYEINQKLPQIYIIIVSLEMMSFSVLEIMT